MPPDSVAALIDTLRRLALLDVAQLDELSRIQDQFPDPKILAHELVRRGCLTTFQVGELLQGHNLSLGQYTLLERLGEGGMGTVYKARHRRLKRIDALKVIRPDRLANTQAVERFHKEAEAVARVSHPNVVGVYDANESDGTHFLAMEYVEGIDLERLVKECGPLPIAQACGYIRQAALGLQHAHEKGLVHRDIKPANLFLNVREGVVKVLDLGLARVKAAGEPTRGLTMNGAVMGTPDYIAPEQAINSHEVDIRADVYSLGCSLYCLLTGRPPFDDGDAMSKLVRHQMQDPEAVEQLRPEVPTALAAVVRQMMAKKPAERIPTPDAVAQALEPFTAPHSIPAAVPTASPMTPVKQHSIPAAVPTASPVTPVFTSLTGSQPWGNPSAGAPSATLSLTPTRERPRGKGRLLAGGLAAAVVLLAIAGFAVFSSHLLDTQPQVAAPGPDRDLAVKGPTTPAEPKKLFTNSVGMKMVPIPAGKFTMGSPHKEIERCLKTLGDKSKDQLAAEGPDHDVEITRPFYMSATNVTLGQFRKFVNEKKYVVIPPIPLTDISPFPHLVFGQQGDQRVVEAERRRKAWESYPDDHPVVHVSWDNAHDFCIWLSEKEGKTYRMPKEAEWEYCSRAGKAGLRYCFGNDDRELASFAWYSANSGKKTHPVGELEPNAWGLCDMHGNARAWCQDSYDPNYYKSSPKINPPGGVGNDCVIRGSSCNDGTVGCRSACRSHMAPGSRDFDVGFRVILVP